MQPFACCEPLHVCNGQHELLEKRGQGNSQPLLVSSPQCLALHSFCCVFQQVALSLSALQSAWLWASLGVLELFDENRSLGKSLQQPVWMQCLRSGEVEKSQVPAATLSWSDLLHALFSVPFFEHSRIYYCILNVHLQTGCTPAQLTLLLEA